MQLDSDLNILHLPHSNIFLFNFSSTFPFENDTITTSYDPYQHLTDIIGV